MGNAFLKEGVCQKHPKGEGVQKMGGEFKYQCLFHFFVGEGGVE